MDSKSLFELNHEIEQLTTELANIKQIILRCNENILKEVELTEQMQAEKLSKFIQDYMKNEAQAFQQENKLFYQ